MPNYPGPALREDIERGLWFVAYAGGRFKVASERSGVSYDTLRGWHREYSERYAEIAEELMPARAGHLATQAEDMLAEGLDAQQTALERTLETLPKVFDRDVSNVMRNIAYANSILNQQVIGPLRGRPNQVVEVRKNESEIWAELQKVAGSIDGTAEEISEDGDSSLTLPDQVVGEQSTNGRDH
jgi:hypothetical protein